jgi:predicted HicB family RNase H-like nuclease
MKDKRTIIRMSSELHEKLTEEARNAGVSLAQYIRSAAIEAAERKCRRCHGTGVEPRRD